MIRSNINTNFPHHLNSCVTTNKNIYVADYTEQTKSKTIKKGTEIFDTYCPLDIECFTVNNPNRLEVDGIPFDNMSFLRSDKSCDSHCECVMFPHNSNANSWICFLELKYSSKRKNNKKNLTKALQQLFDTQDHYRLKGVFSIMNTCYLLASLPKQYPPFSSMLLPPAYLSDMKKKFNIIVRFTNSVEIVDNEIMYV